MKTILITGASRGIGFELTKQYAADQWHVLACCRNPASAVKLNTLKQDAKNNISIYQLDVNDESSIKKLGADLKNQTIDILVNNAGIYYKHQLFDNINIEEWLGIFKTNTIGPFLVSQALIEPLARSNTKLIVNVTSRLGSMTCNEVGSEYSYRSSKAALNAISKSMSIDLLEPYGITVITLHPGWVRTDLAGPKATLDVTESVSSIKKVLSTITLKDTGRFINYDGTELAW